MGEDSWGDISERIIHFNSITLIRIRQQINKELKLRENSKNRRIENE